MCLTNTIQHHNANDVSKIPTTQNQTACQMTIQHQSSVAISKMSADPFKDIKLPPKILKRGRRKGAEVTVIGMPKKRK